MAFRCKIFSQSLRKRSYEPGKIGHLSTEARIVSNELYLRSQYNVQISWSDATYKPLTWLGICEHICYNGLDDLIPSLVTYKIDNRDDEDSKRCKDLTPCQFCHTEFGVEILKLGGTDYLVEFTSWKNLGSGRTPKDLKWLKHVQFPLSHLAVFGQPLKLGGWWILRIRFRNLTTHDV